MKGEKKSDRLFDENPNSIKRSIDDNKLQCADGMHGMAEPNERRSYLAVIKRR